MERLNALEVTLDLSVAIIGAFTAQASALLKRTDIEFLINLIVTQKVLAYTSSITTRLQSRGFDIVNVYEEIHLVIITLENTRNKVSFIMIALYMQKLAMKADVEVKKPRTCQRQRFRQNAVGTYNLS